MSSPSVSTLTYADLLPLHVLGALGPFRDNGSLSASAFYTHSGLRLSLHCRLNMTLSTLCLPKTCQSPGFAAVPKPILNGIRDLLPVWTSLLPFQWDCETQGHKRLCSVLHRELVTPNYSLWAEHGEWWLSTVVSYLNLVLVKSREISLS